MSNSYRKFGGRFISPTFSSLKAVFWSKWGRHQAPLLPVFEILLKNSCLCPHLAGEKKTKIKLQWEGRKPLSSRGGWRGSGKKEGDVWYQSLVWLHFLSLEETFLHPAGKIHPDHLGNGTFGKEGHGRSFINMKMCIPMSIYCIYTLWSWSHYFQALKYANLRVW